MNIQNQLLSLNSDHPYKELYTFVAVEWTRVLSLLSESSDLPLQNLVDRIEGRVLQPLFENAALYAAHCFCLGKAIDDSEHTPFMELWPKIVDQLLPSMQGNSSQNADGELAVAALMNILTIYAEATGTTVVAQKMARQNGENTVQIAVEAIQANGQLRELEGNIQLALIGTDLSDIDKATITVLSILEASHLVKVSAIKQSLMPLDERKALLDRFT